MRDAFISELLAHAQKDSNIVLITADLGFGVLDNFAQTLPRQFINVGIAEQNMAAIAAGLALTGKKVFMYSIGNFPTLRCLEQIRNDICYHNLDVSTVSVGAGFSYGQLGASHFATEDLAIMSALPLMNIIVPANSDQAIDLLQESLKYDGPKYFRLDKSEVQAHLNFRGSKLGVPNILSTGRDVSLIGLGGIMNELILAGIELNKFGISSDVICMNTTKNISADAIIKSISKTRKVVILEEHQKRGGLATSIGQIVLENNINLASFSSFGLDDEFPEIVGDQKFLRKYLNLESESIVNHVRGIKNEFDACI